MGDFDDVLMFTCPREGEKFTGQVLGTVGLGDRQHLVLTMTRSTVRTA